jgi:hypothetical protein
MTYINARDPSTSLGAAPAVPLALPGGCYCGAVRYVLRLASADEARTHICHCSACRKMHGGVFGVTARVAVQALRYEQGKDDLTVSSWFFFLSFFLPFLLCLVGESPRGEGEGETEAEAEGGRGATREKGAGFGVGLCYGC